MINYYVDLSLGTSGGTGSSSSPWNATEFMNQFNSNTPVAGGQLEVYNLKGSYDYTSGQLKWNGLSGGPGKQNEGFTLQPWEGEAEIPPRITFSGPNSSTFFGEGCYIGITSNWFTGPTQDFTIKGMIIEYARNGGAPPYTSTVSFFGGGWSSSAVNSINFENCLFLINAPYHSSSKGAFHFWDNGGFGSDPSISFKGCSLASVGSNGGYALAYIDAGSKFLLTEVNTCYYEDPNNSNYALVVAGYSHPSSITYSHCAFFNSSNLTAIGFADDFGGSGSGVAIIDGGNNLVNLAGASQITNIRQPISTMTLPDDLYPITGSAIIDAGDPSLGLVTDIFGVTRTYDPNPDIGCAEYVSTPIPTPSGNGTITNKVLSTNAGVKEKITLPYQGDPNFAVFGGVATSSGRNTSQIDNTEAGVTAKKGISGQFDPNFSIF